MKEARRWVTLPLVMNFSREQRVGERMSAAVFTMVLLVTLFLNLPPALAAEEMDGELHPQFDEEVRQVLELARNREWEEAQELANELRREAPDDARLQRLAVWVQRERLRQADRRLERELDDAEERDPRFSPGLRDFLFETEPRRLPMEPSLREALEREEQRRLVPESYGSVEFRRERQIRPEPSEELKEKLEQRIDLDLEDATVREVLGEIRSTTGINLAIAGSLPALQEPVTLQLEDVQVIAVLEYLAGNFDIGFVLREDMVWVRGPPP